MNPSSAVATVLVDELIRCGVREAVLCPGSRSAPLAYALQDAERAGRLRLHVRVDERSAGFLALGLAKTRAAPVPVVTTSGSAVANLHPAVLEASHAGVAIIVITADRPPELRGTGANQTTDQVGFFGTAVRWSHDLGAPECRDGQNAVWRSVAGRAYGAAAGSSGNEFDAGPVHLNVPLRDPLVPDLGTSAAWPESLEGRDGGRPWVSAIAPPFAKGHFLPGPPRTLVVVGDLPQAWMAPEAAAVAGAVGWPVVCEPFGMQFDGEDASHIIPRGPLLLMATQWLDEHAPERVVVVGRVTLSRAVSALVRRAGTQVQVVTSGARWSDPGHVASRIVRFSAFHSLEPSEHASDPQWLDAWSEAGRRIDVAAGQVIAESWPSGVAVADTVLAALPAAAALFVGSSNPARDLDLAMSPLHESQGIEVTASRGLAGIDGAVSTAIGLALSQPERPAYALLGDLTFLHDTNGLLIGPAEARPDLTIVVANDDGGGIFATLEPGEPRRASDFERIFGTPTGADLASLCAAHHVGHVKVGTRDELAAEVSKRPKGIRVVEVTLRRDAHRGVRERLRAAAAASLQ